MPGKYLMYTRFLTLLILMSALSITPTRAGEVTRVHIKATTNLQTTARLSQARHLPLMLVFSASACTYCRLLDEDFIKPMLISGDYTHKVLIRHVMIDTDGTVRDFNGTSIPIGALVRRYNVFVTPTVIFVDAQGRPLAHRLVGITNADFYGGDLDHAIDESLVHLRTGMPPAQL